MPIKDSYFTSTIPGYSEFSHGKKKGGVLAKTCTFFQIQFLNTSQCIIVFICVCDCFQDGKWAFPHSLKAVILETHLYSLSRMTGVDYTGVLKILNHKNLEPLPQLSYHYNGNFFLKSRICSKCELSFLNKLPLYNYKIT